MEHVRLYDWSSDIVFLAPIDLYSTLACWDVYLFSILN